MRQEIIASALSLREYFIQAHFFVTINKSLNFRKSKKQGDNERKERKGNVLLNDALSTFYLRLYGVRHMVKDHPDSERGNPLPPHRLPFQISSKGSFIFIIPQTG